VPTGFVGVPMLALLGCDWHQPGLARETGLARRARIFAAVVASRAPRKARRSSSRHGRFMSGSGRSYDHILTPGVDGEVHRTL
jgi:hypothetical protein